MMSTRSPDRSTYSQLEPQLDRSPRVMTPRSAHHSSGTDLEFSPAVAATAGTEISLEGFGAQIYLHSKSFWLSMVFGGFVAPLGSRRASMLWQAFFLFAMLLCGSTCLINCWIRDPPFHALPIDVMVSFVHIPGFYSVFFWGRALSDPKSFVWKIITHRQGGRDDFDVPTNCMSVGGPLLLPVQIATVCLVWAGYAVPSQLFLNEDSEEPSLFDKVHTYSMWIVIPPVVACVVANAALFSFFVHVMYVHLDDTVKRMMEREEKVLQKYAELAANGRGSKGSKSPKRSGSDVKLDFSHKRGSTVFDLIEDEGDQETANTQTPTICLSTNDQDGYCETVIDDVLQMQKNIDLACSEWDKLVVLFLCIAFASLVAVVYDFIQVYSGKATYVLTVWNYCIDAFLVAAGLGIIAGFLAMGAVLTQGIDDLCITAVEHIRTLRVPIEKCAGTLYYLRTGSNTSGVGFKILDCRIQWSHVAGFFSLALTVLGFILSIYSPANVNSTSSVADTILRHGG